MVPNLKVIYFYPYEYSKIAQLTSKQLYDAISLSQNTVNPKSQNRRSSFDKPRTIVDYTDIISKVSEMRRKLKISEKNVQKKAKSRNKLATTFNIDGHKSNHKTSNVFP